MVRETPVERRARDLYEVYCASSNGLNYQGLPCPEWDALTDAVRGHWYTVALRTEQIHSNEHILVGSETDHPPSDHVLGHLPGTALGVWHHYSGISDGPVEGGLDERPTLTDRDLLYAATSRCRCCAGLAYPLDHTLSMAIRAWVCSRVLKGDSAASDQTTAALNGSPALGEHDSLPWAFWKVRKETSINNTGGHTTRPPGTVARTVGMAKCPKCDHEWQSEPYSACDLGRHWRPGPCSKCGHAVAAGLSWSSKDGPAIETRYADVVQHVEPHA